MLFNNMLVSQQIYHWLLANGCFDLAKLANKTFIHAVFNYI